MANKTLLLQKRKPRLLWANPFCLLDTSSGASMSVRQMLHQLLKSGYDVQVLGATIFDNPKGMGLLKAQHPNLGASLNQLIQAEDDGLAHQLLVTYSTARNHMTAYEEGLWHNQYLYMLDNFKPDVVWFYGGQTLDILIPDDARDRGIPVAFYLGNANYKSGRWCRDIDLIITDSEATAQMYKKLVGYSSKPLGKFIDPERFVAQQHERKHVLFVNPSLEKGASVFIQLAIKLEATRPDIMFEVVESRADWPTVLQQVTTQLGQVRGSLQNVIVTPNTSDMRGPYSRARVVAAFSLVWESSGRMLAEAMLNGIPALITNRGGMPEMIDNAGLKFDFPTECYEKPYLHLLNDDELQPIVDAVLAFYDDEPLYQEYVTRAQHVGAEKHHIDRATDRLLKAFSPLVKKRAGDQDFAANQKKRHRQSLVDVMRQPTFKPDGSYLELVLKGSGPATKPKPPHKALGNFDWQLNGKIMVLDNRAKLLKTGALEKLVATGAFGVVSFDPASEVPDDQIKKLEGNDSVQVFRHLLLGDGQPAQLNVCLAAEMTSTLKTLPLEQMPVHRRASSQVLTQLPIDTIALDRIVGLTSVDWLILDELSDAAAILEHGKTLLENTLIVQVRVAFQPTHEGQPDLATLQHWAAQNRFRFYRFNDVAQYSRLPAGFETQGIMPSEQESADVLFLPTDARLEQMRPEHRTKLAFIMATVFDAQDLAYSLLAPLDHRKAKAYLIATGVVSPP